MTASGSAGRVAQAGRSAAPGVAVGGVVLAVTWAAARRLQVHPTEVSVMRTVNGAPDGPAPVLNVTMQYGALASPLVIGALAAVRGDRRTGALVAGAGTATWALAKAVKQRVGRGRPTAHVPETQVRGRPQSGLGFPSGHAGVATCTSVVLWSVLPRSARPVLVGLAGATALARVYVGAHLPLDVLGGAALGLGVGSVARALGRMMSDTQIS